MGNKFDIDSIKIVDDQFLEAEVATSDPRGLLTVEAVWMAKDLPLHFEHARWPDGEIGLVFLAQNFDAISEAVEDFVQSVMTSHVN